MPAGDAFTHEPGHPGRGPAVPSRTSSPPGRATPQRASSRPTFSASWLVAVTCLLALAPTSGRATERRHVGARTGLLEVPLDELVAAVRRKDRAEMGRLAERIGPARLVEALRRADAQGVQAGLVGITTLVGSARLIGPITDLLTVSDAAIAAAAARTLGEVLAPVTLAELDDWDVAPDAVARTCAVLRGAALLPTTSTLVRLAALEALGDAAMICPPAPDLLTLLKDPTPAVRRATALVVRPQQRLATGGFSVGTRDVDPTVASAAVAALCEAMAEPAAWPKGGVREPNWEQTRQLARRLLQEPATATDDAVVMLDCLDPTAAADRQIMERLRTRRHTPLGDRAAEIVDRAQSRPPP